MSLEWYDKYNGPKALNRTGDGRWKCLLAGLCPVTRGYGDTPEEAITNCRESAKQTIAVRKALAEKDEETREKAEWER